MREVTSGDRMRGLMGSEGHGGTGGDKYHRSQQEKELLRMAADFLAALRSIGQLMEREVLTGKERFRE